MSETSSDGQYPGRLSAGERKEDAAKTVNSNRKKRSHWLFSGFNVDWTVTTGHKGQSSCCYYTYVYFVHSSILLLLKTNINLPVLPPGG